MYRLIVMVIACFLFSFSRAGAFQLREVRGHLPDLQLLLQDDESKTVTEETYRGSVALLTFGFTACADRCPVTLAKLAAMLNQLDGDATKVRVLFVTIDPEHDTPQVLRQYLAAFRAKQIRGLTGTKEEVAALAQRYRALYRPGQTVHSDAVYLFDATGQARLLGTQNDSAESITDDVRGLLHGK